MIEKKIIFMGTPTIAADYLNYLMQNKYNILAVFTQPPRKKNRGMNLESSPVHKLATNKNITVHTPEILDDDVLQLIKSYNPDLVIVMAYGLLIPSNYLNIPLNGFINIHLSLLPRWRGASPIEQVLINGDLKSGVSIFKLVKKLDSGPILVQKEISLDKNINKKNLLSKLNKVGCDLLIETLPKLFKGEIDLKIQNEKYATYAYKITAKSRKINFNLTSTQILNQIRAHSPDPGAWFIYKGERIKVISAIKKNTKGICSTVLNENFELGCLDGSIAPLYLQRESKKIINIEDFLRGFNFVVGDIINE